MWTSNSRYWTPLATAVRNDSSVFSGCVPAEPRCPKTRGRASVKKSVLRCSRMSGATGRNLSTSRENANWQWRKRLEENGEAFRSERAVGAVMVARNSRLAQVPDLSHAVIDRHMVQFAEFRDRRLALFAGDGMAAEVGQFRQRRLVLFLDVGEYRPHPGRYLVVLAELLRQRIDPGAVFFHREVEMRSGRKAGRTHVSNQLPHVNRTARLHLGTNLREVTVDADHLMLMLDADAIAELAAPSRAYDRAVSN